MFSPYYIFRIWDAFVFVYCRQCFFCVIPCFPMRKGRRKIKVEGELLPLQPLEVNELLLVENQGYLKFS
jgi:hypothetical protein